MGAAQETSKKFSAEKNKNVDKETTLSKTSALPLTNDPLRNKIILDYASLIKYIARKISVHLPPNIDLDDLISAGMIGLMDAIDKYDPERDNKFKTYAEFRVRGAMLDELRNQDWVPRSIREINKKEEKAKQELERRLGRPAVENEIAEFLNITLDEYRNYTRQTRVSLMSFEEVNGVNFDNKKSVVDHFDMQNSKNPFLQLKDKGMRDVIVKTIEELPEKQKLVLSLYYYEDLNLKEIGKILDVTESRVSQLHTHAIQKLKIKLKNILED